MKVRLTPIAMACLALLSPLAHAESSAGAQADVETSAATNLPTVYVDGQTVTGYSIKETSTATKTETPLKDVPQSITIVTEAQIKDQSMQSISDVVRYVPGIGAHAGENNRDQIIFRGTSSSADFYVDGVKDDVQYLRDLYNTKRIEILKGPSGMIFGRGSGGGVLNRVLREADGSTSREVSFQTGSYDDFRVTADVAQGFGKIAARATAMYESVNGFRNGYQLERFGVNPTFAVRAGPNTDIVLGYEFFRDNRTNDRGIPSLNGRPFQTNRSTFFGDPAQSFVDVDMNVASVKVDHVFSDALSIRNKTSFGDYNRMYQNFVPGAVRTSDSTVAITAYNNRTNRKNLFNQTDLTWKVSTGSIKHTVLTGLELGRQQTDNDRKNGTFPVSANTGPTTGTYNAPLSNPQINDPVTFARTNSTALNDGTAFAAALYVQDQAQLTSTIQLLMGLRLDHFRMRFDDQRPAPPAGPGAGVLKATDNLLSPRVGVIYMPTETLSAYASYTLSYLPRSGEQLSSMTKANKSLDPESSDNVEVGLKWDVLPKFALTTAAYIQNRSKVAVTDTTPGAPADTLMLVDGQQVKGIEFGLSGEVAKNWSVAGGYAYQIGEISSDQPSQPASSTAPPAIRKGAALQQVPKHSFSLWNRYNFTPEWGAGLGIIGRSAMFAAVEDRANPGKNVTLAGYARLDGAVYWNVTKNISTQLNFENLLDKTYYANAHSNNNISFGSPRMFRASVTARF